MDANYELSNPNPTLVEKILLDPMALRFEGTEHKPYVLKEVNKDTSEYNAVESLFNASSRGRTITKLQRVENPYLLGHYLLKRKKMQNFFRVEERSLFHGTREECVDAICKTNFDWRRKGSARGHKFGQGVSFSPHVSYARHYTPDRVMFLAKVLVCNYTDGTNDTRIPNEPFDTTINIKGTVIVKYEDDDFYPQYVIHF